MSTVPIYEDGSAKYLLNIIYNVTDKVLEKIDLEKENKHLKLILDNVSDKIGIINKEGEYTYKNKSSRNIIKKALNEQDIKSTKAIYEKLEFYDEKGMEIPYELMPAQRILRGEAFSNYIILGISKNSTQYHNSIGIPLYDKHGHIEGGILMYENITDKIILEEYNIFKEKTGDSFLNYASVSYPSFKIRYLNNQAYKTLKNNCPHIESELYLVGKDFFEFTGLSEKAQINEKNRIKNFVERKCPAYSHTQRIEENGRVKYIKTLFQPIYNEKKQVDRINFLGIDVTKEEVANEKMANALKFQSEAFINSSHEFKTPLNLIFSASQLLDLYLKNGDLKDIKDKLISNNQVIRKNCNRLTKLINNILDISKLEHGFYELNLSNQDIVYLIEDIVQSFSTHVKKIGLRIRFDTNVEEKIVALDLYNFERIMMNLISNAIKFSNPGGIIFIDLLVKDKYIEISVKDEGIGIEKHNLDNIFEKFFQVDKSLNRKSEGTGVGLALVKSLVNLHGGEIYVESTLDKGSIFKIKLPDIMIEDNKINNYIANDRNISETINIELSDIL